MSLNARFLLLRTSILSLFAVLSWLSFSEMVDEINLQWGHQFTERQVLFDKHRTLSPLIREIRLARQMAAEPALIAMALHENDAVIRQRAFQVMERYRFNFRDHSYFAAFARSGNYYFDNASGQYSGNPYRYTLSPKHKIDYWFYATLKAGDPYQVNIDPDTHLGVVKVWINVLIKNGNTTLGVIGTGIDLTEFLKESVDIRQPGVDNFFIDKNMAIQLSADPKLIDYASIAKTEGERIKIDELFKDPLDVERLQRAAQRIKNKQANDISTLWIDYQGSKHLLGIAYLPEVGWYDLTLINQKNLMLLHGYARLPVIFGVFFLLALVVLDFFMRRWILKPIQQLKTATEEVQHGHYDIEPPIVGVGEIAALSISFRTMVKFVRDSNRELENKVQARTEDLQRLTEIDPLTALLNRRGMMDRFDKEIARQIRQGGSLGLLMLDLDHFKQVNDTYGHAVGDLALCTVANILRSMQRNYDYAGRWGGEEFLLLLPDICKDDLLSIAERIRVTIQQLPITTKSGALSLTVSIGAYHSSNHQTLDEMVQHADQALYMAKHDGRNCVRMN